MLAVVTIVGPLLVLAQVRPLVDADRDAAITMAHISRAVDDLRRVALFANLHESGLERLARGAEKVRFAVGDTIIREGDAADACYTVLYGSVAVRRGDADGEIVAKLETDDFFGEIGLLRATARTATVTAAGDCVLYAISADAFRAALDADAMTSSRALEAATGRLAALRDRRPAGAGR
jgi:CRP-like cAMP-binding protein